MIKGKVLLSMILVTFIVTISASGVMCAPVIKIGFVEQQAVFEKSKMGLNIQAQLKSFGDKKKADINKLSGELEELDRKIKNKDLPLDDQQREEMKREYTKKDVDRKYLYNGANEEGNQMSSKLMEQFDEKVKEIVKKVSEAEGFTLVIEKTGIIFYGNPEFDITEKVIAEINKTTQ